MDLCEASRERKVVGRELMAQWSLGGWVGAGRG